MHNFSQALTSHDNLLLAYKLSLNTSSQLFVICEVQLVCLITCFCLFVPSTDGWAHLNQDNNQVEKITNLLFFFSWRKTDDTICRIFTNHYYLNICEQWAGYMLTWWSFARAHLIHESSCSACKSFLFRQVFSCFPILAVKSWTERDAQQEE